MDTSVTRNPASTSGTTPPIPILEPGDRLTRAEFERRYEAMPHLKKAELIEGIVYMPAAVRFRKHGSPHSRIIGWLSCYEGRTPGTTVGDNSSARLDNDNMPQPDALLLINPECGGQAVISDDDYIERAPELVAEVSSSTVSFDLHTKLNVYRRSGVREYLVWRVVDVAFDWFVLRDGEFVRKAVDAEGLLRSETFPGLWLDVGALLAGRMGDVLDVLERGVKSSGHAEFVKRLGS